MPIYMGMSTFKEWLSFQEATPPMGIPVPPGTPAQPNTPRAIPIAQPAAQQPLKQQPIGNVPPRRTLQQILAWPTASLPPPPAGWRPEYMEMSSDAAQKKVANDLLNRGVDGRRAVLLGQKVAEYVYSYSAYPYNVYKRVLGLAGDEDNVDMQQALVKAKQSMEEARPIHDKLKARGYKLAA
jgi:hypothetical protein